MKRSAADRWLDACRATLLLGSAVAGATFCAFALWPKTVDRLEGWVRVQWNADMDRLEAEARDARDARDPSREAAALQRLVEGLGPVRQLDVARPRAVAALSRLIALRQSEGNATAALALLRTLHAIDPRSVLLTRDLARQLFSDPATRAEAYQLLLGDTAVFGSGLAWKLPSHAEAVVPLVGALAQDGRLDEARNVMATALAWPEPAWWSVYWHRDASDPMLVAGGQPRRRADGALEWTFHLKDPVRTLRLLPPAFASFSMRSPSWSVRAMGQLDFVPVQSRLAATENVTLRDGAVQLTGNADPVLTFEFAEELPQADRELRFTAAFEDRDPEWAQRLLLSEHGAKLAQGDSASAKSLASVRANAFESLAVECFWAATQGDYSAERKLRVPIRVTRDERGVVKFSVEASLPSDWQFLRIDLGAGERVAWTFAAAELRSEAGAPVALDLATAGLHDAARDGDAIVATGVDAQIQVRRPSASSGNATLWLEGTVR